MNKFITKQGPRLAAFAAGIVLFSFTANAQNLQNGATGKVNNTGTGKIVFKAAAGEFQNAAAIGLITNAGVFEMLGANNKFTGTSPLSSTAALRVPGLVSYAAPATTQNIWDGYYTSLDMKNAAPKIFAVGTTKYFVSVNYTTAGANRTYTGSTFTYDGSLIQNVAEENTGNGGGYNNLSFTNAGLKTIGEGDAVATGATIIDATTVGGGLVVDGTVASSFTSTTTGTFTQVAGAGDFSVNDGGVVNINGAANTVGANLTVNSGNLNLGNGTDASATTVTGALNLTDAAGTSDLAVNGLATLNVDGGFTNVDVTRTNMTFAGTSLVEYQNGASNIVTTVNANPYGQFKISKSNAAISPTNSGGTNNNIEIATSFAMNGGATHNLDMLASTGGYVNMLSGTANNVTYAANEEVVGEFRRTHTATTGVDYVFNNSATIVNYTTAPATGAYFAVTSNPNGTTAMYDPTRDIERDINLSYDYTGWVATVTAGYQASDVPGSWLASYNESQLRFREGDATTDEKISTGSTYTRVASGVGSLGSVKLAGFKPTGNNIDGLADAEFKSGNDLILRAGPAIWYSVNPGRWSNPATWDEGTEPPIDAEVVIRNNVWAGFVKAYDTYAIPEAHPATMATKITVQSPTAAFPTPSLIIGKDATYPLADFATSITPVTGITEAGRIIVEQITAPAVELSPALLTQASLDATNKVDYVAGLVVYENATITATESLINDGVLNIGGTLGIGQ